jgi:hypothetical protein
MKTKIPRVLPLKATSQPSSKQVLRAAGVPSFRVTLGNFGEGAD